MRVAILSESSADEAALRILVDAVLGVATTVPSTTPLRSRGWHAVRNVLPVITKELQYRTDAEGLVVVVDSNHTYLSGDEPRNRLREFQELVQRCQRQLRPVPGRVPLKIAVGVAAPAIEAWWLCKTNAQITEAAWERGLDIKQEPFSKLDLKKWLYGQEYSSLDLMTRKMIEAARNLTSDLAILERSFPNGFGALAKELRGWRSVN